MAAVPANQRLVTGIMAGMSCAPPHLATELCTRRIFSQNVVATVNLECKLDLKNIALHARNAEYNPKVGAAAASTSHLLL